MRQTLAAGGRASGFAHLLGLGRSAGGGRAAETDDESCAAQASGDDDEMAAARAAGSADDDEAGDDENQPNGKKAKKAKKAATDDGDDGRRDDDDDAQMTGEDLDDDSNADDDADKDKMAAARAAGRRAERARWAKVLKSPAAGQGRLAAACELLASTDIAADALIASLSALPAQASASLRGRMAGVAIANVGAGAAGSNGDQPALSEQILAALAKTRGERR